MPDMIVSIMLTHKHRFHGHGSLRYLFQNGRTSRSRHLIVRYTPNKTRLHSRVAVIVSKKVFKQAVKRNRVRRRVFELIRLHFDQLNGSYDLTITAISPEVLLMPSKDLSSELGSALGNAGILKEAAKKES